MARTDKDRPVEVRRDDPYERGWFIDHRHETHFEALMSHNAPWVYRIMVTGPCDYGPRNNIHERQGRGDFVCHGMLQSHRLKDDSPSKTTRKLWRRQERQAVRLAMRRLETGATWDDYSVDD